MATVLAVALGLAAGACGGDSGDGNGGTDRNASSDRPTGSGVEVASTFDGDPCGRLDLGELESIFGQRFGPGDQDGSLCTWSVIDEGAVFLVSVETRDPAAGDAAEFAKTVEPPEGSNDTYTVVEIDGSEVLAVEGILGYAATVADAGDAVIVVRAQGAVRSFVDLQRNMVRAAEAAS